jgi:hypothetical protein
MPLVLAEAAVLSSGIIQLVLTSKELMRCLKGETAAAFIL